MLEVSALCCTRGEREIFRNVSFALADGAWIHVRGENGAGKTTLLKALTGLLRPASGSVAWNGIPLHESGDDFHRDLLYLGHANGMKDDLDAAENLMITKGLIMSEAVMMGLGPMLGRNYAHDHVYDICRDVVKTGRSLIDLLAEDKEIAKHIDRAGLEKLVDPANYLGVAGEMVDRVLAMRK